MINGDRKIRDEPASFKIRRFVQGSRKISKQTAYENPSLSTRSMFVRVDGALSLVGFRRT